ncbi:MAG TPA: cytochrome c/FTR1 family iron permease [Luteibacter sp.]|uniref:cytochrome c/FTR1 family iron permease n=1 Tax=Luteibacter sp. TaxID=1886636 RepID=UPI002C6DD707|nr:cytochrome c/FTR1 family iron permease [Luteibacter sp.]HVI55987.1 cytochrome c/FTR1 family iron permease [Luteibacter sp.]
MVPRVARWLAGFTLFLLLSTACLAAEPYAAGAQTAWRLLDYIAVDYAGAVDHGAVSSPAEYAEQQEFAATVASRIAALPDKAEKAALIAQADALQKAIAAKAEPKDVAEASHRLAAALLAAYPVPLAPARVPDAAHGAKLFAQNCVACHGATGDGDGPAAKALATPPIAFTSQERARERSVFSLYQIVTQGVDGTPMPSFASLSDDDRWALALYVSHFAVPDQVAAAGEARWQRDATLHAAVPDLAALVTTTPSALGKRIGQQQADEIMGYLRRHPEVVAPKASASSLSVVREKLKQSLVAYRAGDRPGASTLALSAYLDGFEPIEPLLGTRDSTLLAHIEGSMGEYRAAIEHGASADDVANREQVLNSLLDDAEAALSPHAGSKLSTFIGAATILLREGLEALLIVVAMIAFLRKAERMEVMPYVHAGWTGALAAGFLTWVAATWLIGISGASRELTEGFGSVFAAVVLLSVGIWMHGKSQAGQWQRYIKERMATALSGRSAWFLFALAFVVVYREVFETILFYAALWTPGSGAALLAGAGTACVALAIVAWALLRYSRMLPIGKFFNYSSWLMAILTVVLAGKGIAALQEAGVVGIRPLAGLPRVELIGVFPTVQSVAAQAIMVLALVAGFWVNHRKALKDSRRTPG